MKQQSKILIVFACLVGFLLVFLITNRSMEKTGASTNSLTNGSSVSNTRSANPPDKTVASPNTSLAATKVKEDEITTQYKHSKNCYDAELSDQLLQLKLNNCATESRPAFIEKCQYFRQRYSTYSQQILEKKAACPNTIQETATQYFRSLVAAARNKNFDAQYCLIDHALLDNVDAKELSNAFTPDDIIQWVRDAITRGDWKIIEYLANDPVSHRNLLAAVSDEQHNNASSQYAAYRLRQLLAKGAEGEYANQLKRTLAPNLQLAPDIRMEAYGLTPDDEQAGIRWANEMYSRYFSTSPVQVRRPEKLCSYPSMEAVLGTQ